MTLQKRLVAVGFSKQTAKGAAAAQPTFWMGVTDGKPVNWDLTEDVVEVTSEKPVFGEVDRTSVVGGADFTGLVHPKAIGLLLYGALGAIATTGSANPWQHIITPALDLPYLTFFGRAFGSDYLSVADSKIDELELSWDNAGSLRVAVTMMGLTLTWGTTPFTPTNDESVGGTPRFRAAGGTFKLDPASGTPIVRNIISGSLRVRNGLDAVPQAGSVQPGDVAPAVKELEATINLAPDDLLDIRKALTGAAGGTTISNVPIFGSFEWFFTIDANTDLKIESSRFQPKPEMPDADPRGGYLEVGVEGALLQPTSGDAVKATLHNAVTSY